VRRRRVPPGTQNILILDVGSEGLGIRPHYRGQYVSSLFALLKNNSCTSYTQMFQFISVKCIQWDLVLKPKTMGHMHKPLANAFTCISER
jgi:hypothetical protein